MKRKTYDGPTSEEILTADLIALMESSDLPPWRREWAGQQGEHRNLLTGATYRGSNPILLELGAMMRGHTLPLWLGGAQARAEGWFPRKGTKSVRIVRPQTNRRDDEPAEPGSDPITRTWVSYKPVPVFNAADLVGGDEAAEAVLQARIAEALGQGEPRPAQARLETAEAVLEAWPVPTSWGGTRACYSPGLDQIRMPEPEAFTSREAFAATWAHEQAHSTGHGSRLNRPMGGTQGSKAYAREELVAELAAVLICYRLQVGCRLENHAAYLREWAQMLREEPRSLFKVLSQARQAADLVAPEAGA
jgi:antirestriction protein ArdC